MPPVRKKDLLTIKLPGATSFPKKRLEKLYAFEKKKKESLYKKLGRYYSNTFH
jgi:hypothetical protein